MNSTQPTDASSDFLFVAGGSFESLRSVVRFLAVSCTLILYPSDNGVFHSLSKLRRFKHE